MSNSLKPDPFSSEHPRYEEWFVRHPSAYVSELLAVRALLPWQGRGLEIGVGTGRFAGPLGVEFGIDPAKEMLGYCRPRGVTAVQAIAEALPFATGCFDHVLAVTALCFIEDIALALREAWRVLRPEGCIVVAIIDRESPLGQSYVALQTDSVFYRDARFLSASELAGLLETAGFSDQVWLQTLSAPLLAHDGGIIEPAMPGTGRGAFVVVRARKSRA